MQRKFWQTHAIVGAHHDKLNTFPPLKMHIVLELKKFPKPECDSTHDILLHGAEKIFPRKENTNASKKLEQTSPRRIQTLPPTPLLVMYLESSKGLLLIATLGVSSDVTSLLKLVLCDSASTLSWLSSSLVNRLGLIGEPVILSDKGFNATTVVESQRVKFTVSY